MAQQAGSLRRRVLILGAAGRDFHNFNTVYRDDPTTDVVGFTAAQIPGVAGRVYPPELAGPLYAAGIPIYQEDSLETLVEQLRVDEVVFAYSDVPHEHVMHLASRALAAGADYSLLGPASTELVSVKPVIAVTAVRTGAGKSPISRWLSKHLRDEGLRVAVVRHPMPYGDLKLQAVQRFATVADVDAADCTVEEREEYEPHIGFGNVVYAGTDYGAILEQAEQDADLIIWDGGNNDFSFYRPDLAVCVTDALRPDQLDTHHPGETVLRMADVVVINKVDAADAGVVSAMADRIGALNPSAQVVRAASPVVLDDPEAVAGRMALAIEDGPTITHGGMPFGAAYVAARDHGAAGFVDPRSCAAPEVKTTFDTYPHIGEVLPAMGYSPAQLRALEETINACAADVVVVGTPIDLRRLIDIRRPVVRAQYEYSPVGAPSLEDVVSTFVDAHVTGSRS